MARVVISSLADADTSAILTDLASRDGRKLAARYLERFEPLYDRLAEFPEAGPLRPALGRQIRIGIASPYIVIYRHLQQEQTVLVLRLVHGRRRVTGAMLRRQGVP